MFVNKSLKFAFLFLIFVLAFSVSAQTKRRKTSQKPAPKTIENVESPPVEIPKAEVNDEPVKVPSKKNLRTENQEDSDEKPEPKKANRKPETVSRPSAAKENLPVYFYEFTQPNFVVSHIRLEHDENGKGKITFRKKDFGEDFSDPIQLSPETLEILKTHWNALNFLDSTEEYQSKERDYAHLGTMQLKMKKEAGERTVKFNWTENKDAKALADEYRKIGNQYVWMFDITVARENQPLETPRIMNAIDSYLKRSEISDPKQMIPFLRELSEDERVPLITRNHAARLIKEIEKKIKDKN
ncbi:MAG TPA: hypothetical protein VK892_20435 [Pyrinomonadaceae bacterium]|nr:hypothetical protein [Pyrinomonadaceae bacterium]